MMRSMFSGISGIRAHQVKMDVVANNIANVNTSGFKASRVAFQEVLNQTIQAAFAPDYDSGSQLGGMNAKQIGLGVSIGSIDVVHTSNGVQRTDRPFDVAIAEEGFFQVTNDLELFYTRAGNFYIDTEGNLVNQNGYKVCDDSGSPLIIDDVYSYTDFSIDAGGNVKAIDKLDGSVRNFGTIGIAKFTNPEGLMKLGNNLYRETANSGIADLRAPGSEGYSALIPGSLEMSNVDLSQEFTNMIIAQRGFQANARVITTSNSMLEELANIAR
ncbi:MAG: flagellar hook-basal body complex protein [Eubacteriales bacterium]|jgi:flagellar hook protein FlgE|nr:flagellar hook-basal body complex protein [Eubacteriales bacterium]